MPVTARQPEQVPPLSPEQEAALVDFLRRYPLPAKLLCCRHPKVWAVAMGMGMTYDDVNQICAYAAVKVARRWDPERRVKFESFITWQMRAEVQAVIKREKRWECLLSIEAPLDRDDRRQSRSPVGQIMTRASEQEEERTRRERQTSEWAGEVRKVIAKLPERSRTVMDMRHGGMTLAEVGLVLGVTKERVRQIYCEARAAVQERCDALAEAGLI